MVNKKTISLCIVVSLFKQNNTMFQKYYGIKVSATTVNKAARIAYDYVNNVICEEDDNSNITIYDEYGKCLSPDFRCPSSELNTQNIDFKELKTLPF